VITVEQRNLNTQDLCRHLTMVSTKNGYAESVKKKLSILKKYSNIALGKCFLSFRMNSEK
jgi:hypothetical protein